MQISSKTLALAALAVGGLVVGAYTMGVKQGNPPLPVEQAAPASPATSAIPATTAAPATAAAPLPSVGPIKPGVPMPATHPPMPQSANGTAVAPAVPMGAPEAKGSFTHFRVGNRNVKDMLADGNYVWVGTSGGVIRYDTKSNDYRLFDVRGGNLLANGVFYVGHLDNNRIAVGTYGGGLSVYDVATDKWESFNVPHGLADAFVYDMLQTPNKDIWIATWSGVNRVVGGDLKDRSKWEVHTVENTGGKLPNDWIYGLAAGKNGEVWVATEGGLARFKDGAWDHWTHGDGLGVPYEQVKAQNPFDSDPGQVSSHHARQKEEQGLGKVSTAYNPNYIISLAVDQDGVVWCGTWGGGLARFDGQKWTNFAMADGLPANYIFMLHVDKTNRLWVGTSAGLALRKPDGSYKVMTTRDGLFSNSVFSMAFADSGDLWVGSYGGVARVDVKEETLK